MEADEVWTYLFPKVVMKREEGVRGCCAVLIAVMKFNEVVSYGTTATLSTALNVETKPPAALKRIIRNGVLTLV